MKVDLYDKNGKKTKSSVELKDLVWGTKMNKEVIAQVLSVYQYNQRKGTAHSKTRSEVQGGGSKPWRQKGTGRARQGSIRSPLWVGGGVTFGPQPYKRLKKVPAKMQRTALSNLLSARLAEDMLKVVEDFSSVSGGKTKEVMTILSTLGYEKKKVMLIPSEEERKSVLKGARNIETVAVRSALDVNAYDMANSDAVVVAGDAVATLEKRLT